MYKEYKLHKFFRIFPILVCIYLIIFFTFPRNIGKLISAWKIKIQDIYEIFKAKDYPSVFKKYYPSKKVLNKPLFGAVIITKSPLTYRGTFPENVQELIFDFKCLKK